MPQPRNTPDVAPAVQAANEANEKRVENADTNDLGVTTNAAGAVVGVEKAPGGFAKPPLRSEDAIVGDEGKPGSALDVVGKLTREELVRLQTFVDAALHGQGTDSELRQNNGPTMADRVAGLDRDTDEAGKLTKKQAAGHVDVDASEVLSYAVRSNGDGEKILVVVKQDGQKVYKEL